MSLSELPPAIRALDRADKLRLIQLLTVDVTRQGAVESDLQGQSVPIWSPHDAFEGAAALLRVLDQDEAAS